MDAFLKRKPPTVRLGFRRWLPAQSEPEEAPPYPLVGVGDSRMFSGLMLRKKQNLYFLMFFKYICEDIRA